MSVILTAAMSMFGHPSQGQHGTEGQGSEFSRRGGGRCDGVEVQMFTPSLVVLLRGTLQNPEVWNG